MGRTEIAEELTLHVGQPTSKRMLDDWTAESKKRARLPACYVEALCEITNDDRLQRHLLSERLRELLRLGESAEKVILRNKARRSKR